MKLISFILVLLNTIFSYGQASNCTFSTDSTRFHTGNGLNDTYITFYNNGTYKTKSFCDICPLTVSFGTYEMYNDSIIFSDTVQIVYGSHFIEQTDTTITHDQTTYICFIAKQNDRYYLSFEDKETLEFYFTLKPKEIEILERTRQLYKQL